VHLLLSGLLLAVGWSKSKPADPKTPEFSDLRSQQQTIKWRFARGQAAGKHLTRTTTMKAIACFILAV
jgi:hypothetical protein